MLLPLFAALRLVRRVRPRSSTVAFDTPLFQRIGSTAVSVAGVYYLCISVAQAL